MKGRKFVPDLIVMAQSLRNTGTEGEYICMCTPDVMKYKDELGLLSKVYDRIVEIPYLAHTVGKLKSEKQKKIYEAWMDVAFTKLNIMKPEHFGTYNKVLLVDADKYWLRDINALFDLPAPAGLFSHYIAKPFIPNGMMNPYLIKGDTPYFGDKITEKMIDVGLKQAFVLMGSCVLVEPTVAGSRAIDELLEQKEPYGNPGCISMFDEQAFCDTHKMMRANGSWKGQWRYIHQSYSNFVGHDRWMEECKPKCFHYYNFKPRQMPRSQAELWPDLKPWWKLHDKICKSWGVKTLIVDNDPVDPEKLASANKK